MFLFCFLVEIKKLFSMAHALRKNQTNRWFEVRGLQDSAESQCCPVLFFQHVNQKPVSYDL